jgi:hypothetical protein
MPFSYRKISGRTLNREVINQVNMDNFMLPISRANPTISKNLAGNVTGNLTGNVTGNVDGIVGGTTPAAVTATNVTISSGGAVTQLTSKSTGVTLNKYSGQITMHDAALADDTVVSFTLTNSTISTSSCIIANHASAGTSAAYQINADTLAAGSCKINIRNISGGSLSEAIVLNFIVLGITIA